MKRAAAAILALAGLVFPAGLEYAFSFDPPPSPKRELNLPVSLAEGPDSSLFVADAGLNRIVKFSLSGRYLGETGGGAGVERFSYPCGIARRRGFALFVCDAENGRLVQMDERMSLFSAFSLNDKGKDRVFWPSGIAAAPSGLLYVLDRRDGEVLVLEPDGRSYPFFKDNGLVAGRPLAPAAAAVLNGRVFLSDERQGSVLCFDRFGNFLSSAGRGWGVPLSGLTSLGDSLLIVSDRQAKGVRLLTADGREMGVLTTADADGAFPPGAILAIGRSLFTVHAGKNNIAVFRIQ